MPLTQRELAEAHAAFDEFSTAYREAKATLLDRRIDPKRIEKALLIATALGRCEMNWNDTSDSDADELADLLADDAGNGKFSVTVTVTVIVTFDRSTATWSATGLELRASCGDDDSLAFANDKNA